MIEDADEPSIPRTALNKLIKDSARGIRVANEARDLIHTCCLEFVKNIAKEANKICVTEQKKTINQDHTLNAMEVLGFGRQYQECASSVLDECKEAAQRKLKRLNCRLEKCGVPFEELEKQQAELFEKARQEQADVEQSQITWFMQQKLLAEQKQQQRLLPTGEYDEREPNSSPDAVQSPVSEQHLLLGPIHPCQSSVLTLDEDYDNA